MWLIIFIVILAWCAYALYYIDAQWKNQVSLRNSENNASKQTNNSTNINLENKVEKNDSTIEVLWAIWLGIWIIFFIGPILLIFILILIDK